MIMRVNLALLNLSRVSHIQLQSSLRVAYVKQLNAASHHLQKEVSIGHRLNALDPVRRHLDHLLGR
jgi:hypothetical protein